MPVNVANVLQVRDLILAHPDEFNMSYYCWNPKTEEEGTAQLGHSCGTVACIAGWSSYAAQKLTSVYEGEVLETTSEFLGLDMDATRALCLPDDDDDHIYSATPLQAANVLEHLARTGEVNWDMMGE